jgi:hypothetical protein
LNPSQSQRSVVRRLRSAARRALSEVQTHVSRLKQPNRRPRVVIFPGGPRTSSSSYLRAWLLGPKLEEMGWRAIVVPQVLSLAQRKRIIALEKPEVILLQQTRHPHNRPSLYAPIPCVLDADDGDCMDERHSARIALWASEAAAVVGGNRFVADWLFQHNKRSSHVIWTGTPRLPTTPSIKPAARPPIVAWAHDTPFGYPEEATLMQAAFAEVAKRTRAIFWVFGSTETQAAEWFKPIRAAGGVCEAIERMSYERYLEKVAQAAVGLQPVCPESLFCRGKSFGKILAYLTGQVAVVASNNVDHPVFFRHAENGMLVENTATEWADAIVKLIEDAPFRERVALTGQHDFESRLTMDVFAQRMSDVLREVSKK